MQTQETPQVFNFANYAGPGSGVEDREETIKNYQEEKKPCQSKSRRDFSPSGISPGLR